MVFVFVLGLGLLSFSEFFFHFFVELFLINDSVVHKLLFFLIFSVDKNCGDLFVSFIDFSVHLILFKKIP